MRDSFPDPLRLTFMGATAIHDATEAARNFAEAAKLDRGDLSRLAIVVEELVTNLYDHAGLGPEDVFEIELAATDENISLILSDCAKAFDPRLLPLDPPVPDRGGGAGLRLLRDWARRTDYRREAARNRLEVVLPRSTRR